MKRLQQSFISVLIISLLFSPVVYAFTWKANKRLSELGAGSDAPVIAVDGSNIYVVWQALNSNAANYELIFKRSVDGEVNWEADQWLTNTAGESQHTAIAVDSSNIYVVWRDNTPRKYEIYFKRSADEG